MKKLTAILALLLAGFTAEAQREIEENIEYKDQTLNIEVPFASEIILKTWNKPTIYVKAHLSTEGDKYLDLYELDVQKKNQKIDIIARAEPLFKKYQEEYKKDNPGKKNYGNSTIIDGDVVIHDGMEYKFDYVIYFPEGAEIKISSINGNLNSEVINGDFTADLINGNIDIRKYSGDLKLKTINGEITIAVGNSSMKAETIHGNIYADEGLEFTSTNSVVGQQIQRKNASGTSKLNLNTINGNMYLKK